MPICRLMLSVIFINVLSPALAATYPSCILENLKTHPSPDYNIIFNVTKMCLTVEERVLPDDVVRDLKSFIRGALVDDNSRTAVWRTTLTNETRYIITEISIAIIIVGREMYKYVSNGFFPVYHGPGFLTGFGPDVIQHRTIKPGDTREFDIQTTLNHSISSPVEWDILQMKGISDN